MPPSLFSEHVIASLQAVAGKSTKPPRKETPPVPPGFQPVITVQEPVKVTRNLTFTIVGISVAVSVVIDGFIHLLLG